MELVLLLFISGYIVQHIATIIYILRIKNKRSIEGLSLQSQSMYFVGCIMRTIYMFDTRLTDNFFIWIEQFISYASHIYIFYLFFTYKDTRFSQVRTGIIDWKAILPVCLILSFFFHPGVKDENGFSYQMFVSGSMFIESCALLPQLSILRKVGSTDIKLGRYLVFMGISRLLRLIFWVFLWFDGEGFLYLIVADLLHCVFIGDFVYLFITNKSKGDLLLF